MNKTEAHSSRSLVYSSFPALRQADTQIPLINWDSGSQHVNTEEDKQATVGAPYLLLPRRIVLCEPIVQLETCIRWSFERADELTMARRSFELVLFVWHAANINRDPCIKMGFMFPNMCFSSTYTGWWRRMKAPQEPLVTAQTVLSAETFSLRETDEPKTDWRQQSMTLIPSDLPLIVKLSFLCRVQIFSQLSENWT